MFGFFLTKMPFSKAPEVKPRAVVPMHGLLPHRLLVELQTSVVTREETIKTWLQVAKGF